VEWRPYCYGYWEWTDCGWYWVSDEPWAWACYHYGTWVYDSNYGWVWVPDIEWAPAWVYWRSGGGYVGWAPCPPHHLSVSAHVATSAFVFVDAGHVCDPVRPTTVIINNQTIINKTVEITKVRRENRSFEGGGSHQVVINEGPGVAVVEKASGKKFTPVSIREADRHTVVPEKFRQGKVEHINKPDSRVTPEQPRYAPAPVPTPAPVPAPRVVPVNPPSVPGNGSPERRDHNPPDKHEVIPPPVNPPGPGNGSPDRRDHNPPDKHDVTPAPVNPGGPPPGRGPDDSRGHDEGKGQDHGDHGHGGKDKDR